MSPNDLEDIEEAGQTIHISVSSSFVGFIDDMYMTTEKYKIGSDSSG